VNSIPPKSIPPELKAELIHYFAKAEQNTAKQFDELKAELRAEREKRQRESQRLTMLEEWRDEVSADIKAVSGEVTALRGEYTETRVAVREMRAGVGELTTEIKKLTANDSTQETEIHKLKLSLKVISYIVVTSGIAGGVAGKLLALLGG